jgi:hypothetical protein
MRRFPTLEILDKEPVAKISFDAPPVSHSAGPTGPLNVAKEFPALMCPPLIAGVDGGIITSFFARYVYTPLLLGAPLIAIIDSSLCLIHIGLPYQMCTTSSLRSHFKQIRPFLPEPKSKVSSTQKRCRINAIWNGHHGLEQDPGISVGWGVQWTKC